MKKLFLLAVTGCMVLAASAQQLFKLDMLLNATPPAQLTEWGNRREVLTLIVTGQPGLPPADVKIKTEIKLLDGTVVGTTDLVRASTYNIATATAIFTAVDVMPMDKMIFTGKYKSSLLRTGKLPSDNYTICVQLVRPVDFTPASEQKCKSFYLASTQLPMLMMPYNEQVLDAKAAQTAITFRWTALSPRTAIPVSYRLQIFEVLENQNPVQALRSNMPLLDKEVKGTTQYIWRPQLSFYWQQPGDVDGDGTFDKTVKPKSPEVGERWNTEPYAEGGKIKKSGQRFVWTIQTLDDHGLPVTQTDGSGEGRSEPIIFYVGNPGKMKAKEKANRTKSADISAMQYVMIKTGNKKYLRIGKEHLEILNPKMLQCFCPDDPINPVDCENLGEICFNKPDPFAPIDPWWESEAGKKEQQEINDILKKMGLKLKVKEKGR